MPSLGSTSTARTVQLVSPADLPSGYQFVVRVGENQEDILVEVFQSGGVQRGEVFHAMIVREKCCSNRSKRGLRAQPGHFIPFGYWRDGLWDCFRFGLCHPVLCLACWCSPMLLAQVMTRLGLNIWGRLNKDQVTDKLLPESSRNLHNVSEEDIKKANPWTPFRALSTIFTLHFLLIETALSAVVVTQIHARQSGAIPAVPAWAYLLLAMRAACRSALLLYLFVLSFRTRWHVRERYGIPEQTCECGVEDSLVSLACQPCSVAQMARHTADYDSYDAVCCSSTGLSAYAPPSV